MDNYDNWKTQESPAMSAEDLDEQAERDEAAKLEDLRQVAEEFCDYMNRETYFGGWSAEVCEGKVLIVNDEAGDEATHEFNLARPLSEICHRGARGRNWFSDALTGYLADWDDARRDAQAKKQAAKDAHEAQLRVLKSIRASIDGEIVGKDHAYHYWTRLAPEIEYEALKNLLNRFGNAVKPCGIPGSLGIGYNTVTKLEAEKVRDWLAVWLDRVIEMGEKQKGGVK